MQPGVRVPSDEPGGSGAGGSPTTWKFRDARDTAIVIACGPSALGALRSAGNRWRDYPAITINSSWRLHPGADALYCADRGFWNARDEPTGLRYIDLIAKLFRGSLYSTGVAGVREFEEYGVRNIEIERLGGISETPGTIRTGGQIGNSGAQGINLATLWGARRLLLVGFDMCRGPVDGIPDQLHWFGNYPRPLSNDPPFGLFVRGMHEMAADLDRLGIEVLNCCRRSALPYWPKVDLIDAL